MCQSLQNSMELQILMRPHINMASGRLEVLLRPDAQTDESQTMGGGGDVLSLWFSIPLESSEKL